MNHFKATHSTLSYLPNRQPQSTPIDGVTLIELMIVMAIISILMMVFQTPIESFNRVIFLKQVESDLRMNVQRFQLILKSELIQAGYAFSSLGDTPEAVSLMNGVLNLKADLNQDGDVNDSKENISYRFDVEKQALLRKSGKGAFQHFIGGLQFLSFSFLNSQSTNPICLKLTTQVIEQVEVEEMVLCQVGL